MSRAFKKLSIFFVAVTFSAIGFGSGLYPSGYLCRLHMLLFASDPVFPFVVGPEARAEYAEGRRRAQPLETARAQAWERFPNDPVKRASFIHASLAAADPAKMAVWDASIRIGPNGAPIFRSNTFGDLVAEASPGLNTLRVRSRNVKPEQADAIVVGLHGVGSSYSHSGTLLNIGNFFGSRRSTGLRGEVNARRAADGKTAPVIYFEGMDLPFHGGGPDNPSLQNLNALADWMAPRLRELKASGKPVVLFTRSSSVNLALALARRHPDLVDGFLVMSGNFPAPDLILQGDHYAARLAGHVGTDGQSPTFRLNWPGTVAASQWEYDSAFTPITGDPFAGKPRVVWIGEQDPQTPAEGLRRWRIAAGGGNVVSVPGQAHDVMPFQEEHRPQTIERFLEAYKVIDDVIQRSRR